MDIYLNGAEAISLFCRININTKRGLPIRASEMGLLIMLVKSDTELTPVEVAHFFRISKPMVTAMVRSLEKQGYIHKTPSLVDGRSFTLSLTQKARLLVEETIEEYIRKIEKLYTTMGSDDFHRFINLIEQANKILLGDRANG